MGGVGDGEIEQRTPCGAVGLLGQGEIVLGQIPRRSAGEVHAVVMVLGSAVQWPGG